MHFLTSDQLSFSDLEILNGKHLLGDFRNVTTGPKSAPRILIQSFPFILSEVKQPDKCLLDKLLEIETDLQPRESTLFASIQVSSASCHIQAAWSALTQTQATQV